MLNTTPEHRLAERDSYCRVCDKIIPKGKPAVFWYSHRSTGQNIVVCPACVAYLCGLLPTNQGENNA